MNNTGDKLQHNIVTCSRNVCTSSTIRAEHPSIDIFDGNPSGGSREQMGMMEVTRTLCHYANVPVNYVSTLLSQLLNVWLAVLVMCLEHHNTSLHNSSTV